MKVGIIVFFAARVSHPVCHILLKIPEEPGVQVLGYDRYSQLKIPACDIQIFQPHFFKIFDALLARTIFDTCNWFRVNF